MVASSSPSPVHIRPPWKMMAQHTSHHPSDASSVNSCPSPLLPCAPNMLLTSGGLKPFFLARGAAPPSSGHLSRSLVASPSFLSEIGSLGDGVFFAPLALRISAILVLWNRTEVAPLTPSARHSHALNTQIQDYSNYSRNHTCAPAHLCTYSISQSCV